LEETLGFPTAVTNCDEPQSCKSTPSYREINTAKILVIGLGQLGLPVAKYVKDRGFDVYGYDISTKALERAEKTAGVKKLLTLAVLMCISYVFQHTDKKTCSHLK
jgi:phosphoglycerate dehydrogenase-like enzyme